MAVGCVEIDGNGCLGLDFIEPPTEPTPTEPTPTAAAGGVSNFPAPVRDDGNVIRDISSNMAVSWQSPRGDVYLAVDGTDLRFESAYDGVRTITWLDLDGGENRDLIAFRLGDSVLHEAREILRLLN